MGSHCQQCNHSGPIAAEAVASFPGLVATKLWVKVLLYVIWALSPLLGYYCACERLTNSGKARDLFFHFLGISQLVPFLIT